jgi:hypothetical protein
MTDWKQLPGDIPEDQEEVWTRIKYYYGPPFLSTWSAVSQDFTSSDNSIVYPAWCVARWKSKT